MKQITMNWLQEDPGRKVIRIPGGLSELKIQLSRIGPTEIEFRWGFGGSSSGTEDANANAGTRKW